MAIDYSSFLICYHNDGFEVYSNGVVILIQKNGQTIKENVHYLRNTKFESAEKLSEILDNVSTQILKESE